MFTKIIIDYDGGHCSSLLLPVILRKKTNKSVSVVKVIDLAMMMIIMMTITMMVMTIIVMIMTILITMMVMMIVFIGRSEPSGSVMALPNFTLR